MMGQKRFTNGRARIGPVFQGMNDKNSPQPVGYSFKKEGKGRGAERIDGGFRSRYLKKKKSPKDSHGKKRGESDRRVNQTACTGCRKCDKRRIAWTIRLRLEADGLRGKTT